MGLSLRSIADIMKGYSTTLQKVLRDIIVLKKYFPFSFLSKKVELLVSSLTSYHRDMNERNEISMSIFDNILVHVKAIKETVEIKQSKNNIQK